MAERIPIERDDGIVRTRHTAALARLVLGATGVALIAAEPTLLPHPALGAAGFGVIVLSSVVQLSTRVSWLRLEESLAASAAFLIVGFGEQQVNVLSLLWLVALATGVMARGGRVHWLGRSLVLAALALPVALTGSLSGAYAAFCAAVIGLQLTSGRLTVELNRLLRQARLDAESAETLLLAGDIAARVAHSAGPAAPAGRAPAPGRPAPLDPAEAADARRALERLLTGEGLAIAVQPIVDLASGRVHAYEALARFGRRREDRSPLNWFALAEQLGERVALERACLEASLRLFAERPAGTLLAVNLSVAALLDEPTAALLEQGGRGPEGLGGLIVEITEETLVAADPGVTGTIESLRERGARLAVDDIGAGYSGLRQITTVLPDYLKLDRSLVAGIDLDEDRGALVSALCGYASQVGSRLIAEGIENEAELECLRELEVPLVQGFHVAEPGPPWPPPRDGRSAQLGRPDERLLELA